MTEVNSTFTLAAKLGEGASWGRKLGEGESLTAWWKPLWLVASKRGGAAGLVSLAKVQVKSRQ